MTKNHGNNRDQNRGVWQLVIKMTLFKIDIRNGRLITVACPLCGYSIKSPELRGFSLAGEKRLSNVIAFVSINGY